MLPWVEPNYNKQFERKHPFIVLFSTIGSMAAIFFAASRTGNIRSVLLPVVYVMIIVLAFAIPLVLFFRTPKENRSVVALLVALATLAYLLYSQYGWLLEVVDISTIIQTIF